jgi:hypothetical protein
MVLIIVADATVVDVEGTLLKDVEISKMFIANLAVSKFQNHVYC